MTWTNAEPTPPTAPHDDGRRTLGDRVYTTHGWGRVNQLTAAGRIARVYLDRLPSTPGYAGTDLNTHVGG